MHLTYEKETTVYKSQFNNLSNNARLGKYDLENKMLFIFYFKII
jgi:hypothetical protein